MGMLALSPRCQCAPMQTPRRRGPRRALIALPCRRGQVGALVPEWVAHSTLGAGFGIADLREGRGPRDVLPRFARWAENAPPPALAGERRFTGAPAPCRCKVPTSLPNRLRALRQASRSCAAFLESLRAALEEFTGARGTSEHMLALGRDAALALNWEDLVSRPPTREQYLAFLRLAKSLKPALAGTLWPPALFPHVRCEWPAERGPNGWFQQFKSLARRLRQEAADPCCPWWRVEQWLVQPVVCTRLEASVGQLLADGGTQQPAARACVCRLIGDFVGAPSVSAGAGAPSVSAGARAPFWATIDAVAGLGHGARLRGARSQRSTYAFRGGVGSWASLAAPPRLRGKVVTVVGAKRALDHGALEAALATLPKFTAPGVDGAHCYHAVRLVHRVRLLRAVDSCCERWGSMIHQLWDGNNMWHPMRIAGRLLLRDAGLAEHTPAAEGVVAEVSHFLGTRGMDPFVKDCRLRDAPPLAAPPAGLREVCRRALRESPYTRELAKDAARPSSLQLRPAAREAVEHALRAAGAGNVEPLPLFHESVRALRRDRAASARTEALQEWLQSEMAAAWRQDRAAIFGSGEGPPILRGPDTADEEEGGTGGPAGVA